MRLCRALLLHRAPLADLVTLVLQLTIQKGTKIRLKIVGTRVDATEIVRRRSPSRFLPVLTGRIGLRAHAGKTGFSADTPPRLAQFCIGTIKEDYLGPLG